MARQALVIGLGQFGMSLARALAKNGSEVMAVDIEETHINEVAPYVADAVLMDAMDEEAFAATVAESDERGVGFTVYSATLAKGSGQIAFVTGEGFQVTGVTVSNLFSSSNLAGIDISDWTEEGPLSGSFFLTGFEPDGAGFDPDVDLDLTVAEPTAIEAR